MINYELFSHVFLGTPPIPAVALILIDAVNLVLGPKSGFKNKCRARAGFVFKMRPAYTLC